MPSFGSTAGAAFVFVFDGTTWILEGTLIPSDEPPNNTFGNFVSLCGDRALIGAPYEAGGATAGAAYIFAFDGTSWSQEAKLVPNGSFTFDFFGCSVSLEGSRAPIGALGDDTNTGAAYIFAHNGTAWNQMAKLTPPPGDDASQFGIAVSLSGQRALIGSLAAGAENAAYVFAFNGTTWDQEATLSPFPNISQEFGLSVSLSGNRALVGAPGFNVSCGAAYLYVFDGTKWSQEAQLLASDGAAGDQFGEAVSLSGKRALIGAGGDDGFTGSAYLFASDGVTWSEQDKLIASDGATLDHFGKSVSLAGRRGFVGSSAATDNGGSGVAYVFGRW
jgi:hypothetical protein